MSSISPQATEEKTEEESAPVEATVNPEEVSKVEESIEAPASEASEEVKPQPVEEKPAEISKTDSDDEDEDFNEDLSEEEFSDLVKEKGIAKVRKEMQKFRKESKAAALENESLKAEIESLKASYEREKSIKTIADEFNLTDAQLEFISGSTLDELKASARKYVDALPVNTASTKRTITKLVSGSGETPVSAKFKSKEDILKETKRRKK